MNVFIFVAAFLTLVTSVSVRWKDDDDELDKTIWNLNKYNYMVFVDGSNYNCNAGIIGPKHVITAAHCVTHNDSQEIINKKIKVILGFNYFYEPIEVIEVAKICVLKSYASYPALKYGYGDLAVLELKRTFENDQAVLKLPDAQLFDSYIGKMAFISSYSPVEILEDGYVLKENSNYMLVDIFNKTMCENAWPHIASYIDYNKIICAKVKILASDTCQGDAGAPLVYNNNDVYILVGVLSFSPENCNESQSSGVYTRISGYTSVISNVLNGVDDEEVKCLKI